MSQTRTVLSSKMTLTAGQTISNAELIVPQASFVWDSDYTAVKVWEPGCSLVNVTIRSDVDEFLDSWRSDAAEAGAGTGIPRNLSGLNVQSSAFTAKDVHIEGFGQTGAWFIGCQDLTLRKVSGTRCFQVFAIGRSADGDRITRPYIDGLSAWNTWGPGPLAAWGGDPVASVLRPGEYIGGDGVVACLDDGCVKHVRCTGELYGGLKIVRTKRVSLRHLRLMQLQFGGTELQTENVDHSTDGIEDLILRHFVVDKSLGAGALVDAGNGIQCSWNISGLVFDDFMLQGDGNDGHGIELASPAVALDARNGTIGGFNGVRGAQPAAALHRNSDCTINADFLTVIDFTDQLRQVFVD